MSIHIVSHGRVTEHIKRGLQSHSGVDEVHLLSSNRFLETSHELADELTSFGYGVEVHEISAFELRSVVNTIVTIAREHPGEKIYVNITGGLT